HTGDAVRNHDSENSRGAIEPEIEPEFGP
ncbi:MAG: hypothetical protein ACI9W2_003713, partial [Gammaproteobacteria bacterium]